MRIITGSAKGVSLLTLEGDATRPTSARAKEALFSMLQFDIEGRRVLDLFGGSGQLGLEAHSRGAAACTFVDAAPEAVAVIRKNIEKTGFADRARVQNTDYRNFLRKCAADGFDLVFLDPPYASDALADALLGRDRTLRRFILAQKVDHTDPYGFADTFAQRDSRHNAPALVISQLPLLNATHGGKLRLAHAPCFSQVADPLRSVFCIHLFRSHYFLSFCPRRVLNWRAPK